VQILNLSAIQNFTHVLDLVGPLPAATISSITGVIGFLASHEFTNYPFLESSIEYDPVFIEVTSAKVGYVYPEWKGVHATGIVEFRRYPDENLIVGRAPIQIAHPATTIGLYPANVEIADYRVFLPSSLFIGYSTDGTSITIPISTLSGLTAAEADATTGDWREVLQAILRRSFDYSQLFVTTPRAEQARTYGIHKQDFYNSTIDSYFTVKFLTDMGEPNVAPEP
jgi:hypothetical protein